MRVEDTTKESVYGFGFKSKCKSKGRGEGDCFLRGGSTGHCSREPSYLQKGTSKARDFKENVTTAARRAIPQGSARKAKTEESQKENETVTRGKAGIVELGRRNVASRWRRTSRRLEVP